MKKYYKAPEILFEDFSLSNSIASVCEMKVSNHGKDTCAIVGTGGIMLFSDPEICEYRPEDLNLPADRYDGFCYHVPSDFNNIFNS